MYIKQLAYGTYTMCGIGIALVLTTETSHPALGAIGLVLVAQIVDIGSFEMGKGT